MREKNYRVVDTQVFIQNPLSRGVSLQKQSPRDGRIISRSGVTGTPQDGRSISKSSVIGTPETDDLIPSAVLSYPPETED